MSAIFLLGPWCQSLWTLISLNQLDPLVAILMLKFQDSVTLSGVKITGEGYLVADAFAVRTGIQQYAGYEVGRPDLAVVNVYRSADEVFSAATLQSFSHTPVTNEHPKEAVTKDNWKDLAVGEASTDVLRDGGKMKIPLILKDASAIVAVQSGKRELSAGYGCELVWQDGVTEDGTAYQAKQVNIRANHIAIVQRGRAGSEFRIGDSADAWGAAPIIADEETKMNLQKITFDGITIEVTDAGAQAIAKLQGQIEKLVADAATATTALAAKDTKIGELTVELKTAQDAKPTAAILDALATERQTVIDAAKKIKADIVTDGKDLAAIRKEAVASKFGDDMVKDASADTVNGMFLAATKDAGTTVDPVRQTLVNRVSDAAPAGNTQDAYEARTRDAWKGPVSVAQ